MGVVFSPDYSNENYHFRPYLPQYVTNLEDAVPYEEWKYMEDSNGNTIPDIVEKQIAEDPLNVDNAWLEDKYGYNVKGFIKDDNVNADKNKKKLVETLSYLYNHYIEPVADAASDYIGKSLNQIVKGNFTDDVTLLGTAGEIVLGIFDLDLVCDLRDITYDIGEWGEIIIGDDEFSWSFAGQSFLDLVGIVPVIGAVKYSDKVGALFKKVPDLYKEVVESTIKKNFKNGIKVTECDTTKEIEELYKILFKKYSDKIVEIVGSLTDNDIHHIVEGSKGSNHHLELLSSNKDWNEIKNIIIEVMVNGKEEPYLSVYCKKYVIDCKVIQVNYNKYNGAYKISDAYVIIDNPQINVIFIKSDMLECLLSVSDSSGGFI